MCERTVSDTYQDFVIGLYNFYLLMAAMPLHTTAMPSTGPGEAGY